MTQQRPGGNGIKASPQDGLKDRLHHFLLENGSVRGALCRATDTVSEMRASHGLGVLETLVLGHGCMGAVLMASNLKSLHERLLLQVDCSGPIRGLTVEANGRLEVRGYLRQVPIPVASALDDFDLSSFFGAGFLKVTRHIEGAKTPFTGQVMLEYGNLAQDLALYHVVSEQIPTAFHLSVQFDPDGGVAGAGGMLVQVMPGADGSLPERLDDLVRALPSLGAYFAADGDPEALVAGRFRSLCPELLGSRSVAFHCPCSRERLVSVLMLLPEDDLLDLRDNGPFPLEMLCRNCNTTYRFDAEEIRGICARRRSDN